jgi:general secretion pathway protein D
MLIENQKIGVFDVGSRVPYLSGGTYGSQIQSTNGQLINTAQPVTNFITVGLNLEIHPTINNNGLIEMETEVRNNAATFVPLTFAGQSYTQPQVATQELQSTLIIPSGETRVIGGLVHDSKSDSKSGVPGLIKIPVLGPLLFGSFDRPSDQNFRRNLLIFLTPTIVVEKPSELHKYKGRIMVDEGAMDVFTTPSLTLSDTMCEPLPVFPPTEQAQPTTQIMEPSKVLMPEKTGPPEDIERTSIPEPEPTIIPMMDTEPTGQQEVPDDGVTELRHMKIEERSSSAMESALPPITGPKGALTGSGATTGAAPATAVTATPAVVTAKPPVVTTPVPAPTAAVVNRPGTVVSQPAPPTTETRFNR